MRRNAEASAMEGDTLYLIQRRVKDKKEGSFKT